MADVITNTFRLYNGTALVTGQAGNLDFRVTPYAAAIAGLTFTETPAASGNYVVTGFTNYYENVKCYLSGVYQGSMGIFDAGDPDNKYVSLTGNQTIAGVKTLSSSPIIPAATGTGQALRYDEGARLPDDVIIAGKWQFTGAGNKRPYISAPSANPPTSTGDFTDKIYVDSLFGTVSGERQSGYEIQCLPQIALNDYISMQTIETCVAYLKTLSNYTTYRASIKIGNTGATNNYIALTTGDWLTNGIDIVSDNKIIIQLSASNNSPTADSRLRNVYILDAIAAARSFTNITLDGCDINCSAGQNLTLTSVVFGNRPTRIKMNGGTLTLANCTGGGVRTNAAAVITGTVPYDVIDGIAVGVLGV